MQTCNGETCRCLKKMHLNWEKRDYAKTLQMLSNDFEALLQVGMFKLEK